MKLFKTLLVGTMLAICCTSVLSQPNDIKKRLVGSWIYAGFENKSDVNDKDKAEQQKGDEMNAGLTITFKVNGAYEIWEKGNNKKQIVASGATKFTKNGKHIVIQGLDGDIEILTNEFLKLYSPGRPLMVFKRVQQL